MMPVLVLALAALLLLLAALWPATGILARLRRARVRSERVDVEDALKHMRKAELYGRPATHESVAGALDISRDAAAALAEIMERRGLVERSGDLFSLTSDGRSTANHVIRAHRLWERHLADATGYDESQWHRLADRREHDLSPEDADRLSAELGHPVLDPHGDPIPEAGEDAALAGGSSLTGLSVPALARIVHIEDEPEAVYAQLVAEGFSPGQVLHLVERTASRVTVWAGGEEHVLAPVVAANLTVVALEASSAPVEEFEAGGGAGGAGVRTLADLPVGAEARVVALDPRCRGAERRRLMDLGLLPGAVVSSELSGPFADPSAYRVRDTLLALRRDQARHVRVIAVEGAAS